MKKRKARKWLSILLCIVLAFSMFPVVTSAAEGDVEYFYCDENGENWKTGTKADGEYTLVTSDDTSWSNGWYVVEGSIANSNRITVSGNVHLILADGCEFNATSGILVNSGNSLTIYGQSLGTGKLIATAWTDGGDAGIGGVHHSTAGSITINGGNIEATGYNGGAGIGGGHAGAPQSVTINGGNVIANGGACSGNGSGAGIGCGYAVSGGTVKINGGTVVANGNGKANQNAPGIGGGSSISSDNTTVIINGGVVTATCLDNSVSGIGGNFSTGTDGNAVIFTNSISDQSGKGNWNGVIFEGNSGRVYGTSITLTEDFTIESDITLTVSDGQTLIIPDGVTLTNNGTITDNGTIINNGTITNNGTYTGNAPKYSAVYLDADGIEKMAICDAILTADNIGEYTTIYSGWYLVKGTITADSRINIIGDVHLILEDGCDFTVNGGIQVRDDDDNIDNGSANALTLYAQSTDESTMGKLTAQNVNNRYAGIGGDDNCSGGTIIINGSTVTATGGEWAAGIGGSDSGSGGTITINGGNVYAYGKYGGVGIGGGSQGSGGNITISGGTVTANGGSSAAGIGGSDSGSGGEIAISGNAIVNATGGELAAGIGGSSISSGGIITISGGTVTANGGSSAAGIGGGTQGSGGNITISGGTVTATGSSYGAGIGGGGSNWTNGGSGGIITISGGTVTANGGKNGGAGIGGGQGESTSGGSGTFSTGTNGKAVIFASSISDQSGKANSSWSGVIFENNDGKVYGSVITPTEDFTIESGKSLLIHTGSTLTISGITGVNNGSVYMDGTLGGSFSGTGSIFYPLTVTGGTAVGDTSTYLDTLYGKAGGTVTLTGTDVPVGQAVSGWTASDSAVTVENNAFTMPESALTITAQYVNAPTYMVTIPATVEIGEEITISATGVNVVSGSQLEVKLSGTSEADNSFKLKTDEGAELSYGITKDSTALTMGSTVLTVAGGTADNTGTANLSFVKQGSEAYAGTYKGTVTFTVSVEEVISP